MFDTSQLLAASGEAGFYDHPIEQSLRFNDGDQAYLSRTPSSAGNRKTWTWSGWVKRSDLGHSKIFTVGTSGSSYLQFRFQDDNTILMSSEQNSGVAIYFNTSAVYRDTSAWYHLVAVVDTTNATSADRVKLYVNGERVTDLASSTTPSQNTDLLVNSTTAHLMGALSYGTQYDPFGGYMAEVHFIDGTALDASSFGETKSGVWIPKAYAGSYGTNGFYLDFGNSGSIGADVSGNGNNFTANNLAATDVVLDSPTNNFATLNPLAKQANVVLSDGSLKAFSSGTDHDTVIATMGVSSGQHYWEVEVTSGNYSFIGVVGNSDLTHYLTQGNYVGSTADSYGWYGRIAYKYNNSSGSSYGSATAVGDIVGVALDMDAGTLTFYKNGVSQGTAFTGLSGTMIPAVSVYNSSSYTVNFGQDSSFAGNKTAQGNTDANGYGDFYYAPPTGYLALCTANLEVPDAMNPALDNSPQDYFDVGTYTGTGSSSALAVSGPPNPDLVWLKCRNSATSHSLLDALRDSSDPFSMRLYSNLTSAEYDYGSSMLTPTSTGFNLTTSDGDHNTSSNTYVAWQWVAGGSGVSNTDGSITSTVSANTDAGFSIVSFVGGTGTVGTGLSQAVELYIMKDRDTSGTDWYVNTTAVDGSLDYGYLNLTNAFNTSPLSLPTSDAFYTSTSFVGSGKNGIAYCFHSVEGFSKFGSYTANGSSSDGPFVYTGFKPAFVMCKCTNTTGSWVIVDNERLGYNPETNLLQANSSSAELGSGYDPYYKGDLLSNGFKIRSTNDGWNNNSGDTHIYMAFAENPFKFGTAQ